jgi:hypothetical protein
MRLSSAAVANTSGAKAREIRDVRRIAGLKSPACPKPGLPKDKNCNPKAGLYSVAAGLKSLAYQARPTSPGPASADLPVIP